LNLCAKLLPTRSLHTSERIRLAKQRLLLWLACHTLSKLHANALTKALPEATARRRLVGKPLSTKCIRLICLLHSEACVAGLLIASEVVHLPIAKRGLIV
jgi:hypothetical protein